MKTKRNIRFFILLLLKKEDISFASGQRRRDVFIPTHLYSWPFCFRSRDDDKCVVRISLLRPRAHCVMFQRSCWLCRYDVALVNLSFRFAFSGQRKQFLCEAWDFDEIGLWRPCGCGDTLCRTCLSARESRGFCRKV